MELKSESFCLFLAVAEVSKNIFNSNSSTLTQFFKVWITKQLFCVSTHCKEVRGLNNDDDDSDKDENKNNDTATT